jgi:hypothetical protein
MSNQELIQKLSEKAMENLQAAEDEIEQSSQFFKPKDGRTYLLMFNPEEKIEVRLNEKFKDAQGRPVIRYEFKVTHVNTGKQQLWETSKMLCSQIIAEMKKGYTVLQIQRFGSDRSTIYKVTGVD